MSYDKALRAIDEAHSEDPNVTDHGPYELYYANKCTTYLKQLDPKATDILKLAVRAQHLRRWEVPRSSYPMTKIGYHSWRTNLKRRQGDIAAQICRDAGYSEEDSSKVASMIRKDNFKADPDTQTLEDVACLVFLDDQFEAFNSEHSEDKIITILRKTWPKMSETGHQIALEMQMSLEAQNVIEKALS